MSKLSPILLAISGQTKPYTARRYFKSPLRGTHAIDVVYFDEADEFTPDALETFRKGLYPAQSPTDHLPEGST